MSRGRIYVAEEDKQLQRGLSAALKRSGFEVLFFEDGYSIVEMMDNWPDIFLIDIELPGINGIEICKWLKSHQSSQHVPVILFAGEPYLKILAASARPDDYMDKPLRYPELIAKIKECLLTEKASS